MYWCAFDRDMNCKHVTEGGNASLERWIQRGRIMLSVQPVHEETWHYSKWVMAKLFWGTGTDFGIPPVSLTKFYAVTRCVHWRCHYWIKAIMNSDYKSTDIIHEVPCRKLPWRLLDLEVQVEVRRIKCPHIKSHKRDMGFLLDGRKNGGRRSDFSGCNKWRKG